MAEGNSNPAARSDAASADARKPRNSYQATTTSQTRDGEFQWEQRTSLADASQLRVGEGRGACDVTGPRGFLGDRGRGLIRVIHARSTAATLLLR